MKTAMYRDPLICALVFLGIAVAQSDNRVAPRQTFHAVGTISDAFNAVIPHVEVRFDGDNAGQTLIADEKGSYNTDLPVGSYPD